MKTYHSHQGSAFVMGFMCLLFVATYALFLFMPAFEVLSEGEVYTYTGFDFLVIGAGTYIQMVIPDIDISIADQVVAFFNGTAPKENIVVDEGKSQHVFFSRVAHGNVECSKVYAAVEQKCVIIHPDASHVKRVGERVGGAVGFFQRIPGHDPVVQGAVNRRAGADDEHHREKKEDFLHFFSISSSIW